MKLDATPRRPFFLTFEDFSHGNETGDAVGDFARNNGEVVLDFEVGGRIGPRQHVQHQLQQLAVLKSRLAAGEQRLGSDVVRLRRVGSTLQKRESSAK